MIDIILTGDLGVYYRDKLESIARKVVEIIAFFLFIIITLAGALRSAYLDTAYELKLTITEDSVLLNLLFVVVLFLIIKAVADFVMADLEKRRKILLLGTLVYTFGLCLVWAAFSKCFPTADQASVYYGAKHFAVNNFEDISFVNSYFSCYPHQMGLALFYEIILRIFRTESFHLLQAVNAVCNCITVFSLYKITNHIFEERKVGVYLLLIMVLCFPLLWYTPFVYGDLPSLAFALFGIWMLLEGLKCGKWWQLLLSLVALGIAAAVRKNTLIFILAIICTLFVYVIKEKKYQLILYMVLLLTIGFSVLPGIQKLYEYRSGTRLNEGVPGISHVVMGLQESYYAPGWYNGYNFTTYVYDADYNKEKATQLSKEALNQRSRELIENPRYAASFFGTKFMAEWLNTGYACFDSTAGKYYERAPLIESMFSGTGYRVIRFFMDKYQFFVYLMALFFLCFQIFGKGSARLGIMAYTLLTVVIGGAVFYLFWEGSGRYILPYFVITLPYAAAGSIRVGEWVLRKIHR